MLVIIIIGSILVIYFINQANTKRVRKTKKKRININKKFDRRN